MSGASLKRRFAALTDLYRAGRHEEAGRVILDALAFFRANTPTDQRAAGDIAGILKAALGVFVQPDFCVPAEQAPRFLRAQPVIANLAASGEPRTTDAYVNEILSRPVDMVKLLTLSSPRNCRRLETGPLFEASPSVASLWFATCFASAETYGDPVVHANMLALLREADARYRLFGPEAVFPYIHGAYIDPESEPPLKRMINARLREHWADTRVRNTPNRRKIAIVTGLWHGATAVYRCLRPLVDTLRGRFELALVRLGPQGAKADTSGFDDVRDVAFEKDGSLDVEAVTTNDFQAVFYPDAAFTPEGKYLANLRLAPVQMAGYGHPVSTWGAEIDYFIGGAEVEIAEDARANYSERLVLLPGMGAHPVLPTYERTGAAHGRDEVIVNCPWSPMKLNAPLLADLRAVAEGCRRRVRFRFFPGWVPHRDAAFLPLVRDVETQIGADHVEVMGNLTPDAYMAAMEEGDLSIDSFPFGGYNTITDALHLGKPVVAREGRRFQNRASAALLRRFGMEDCIAGSAEQFVETVSRLVDDEGLRREKTQQVQGADLKERLYGGRDYEAFRRAVEHLIENHESLRAEDSREAIIIR